jgi:hypothetical protein
MTVDKHRKKSGIPYTIKEKKGKKEGNIEDVGIFFRRFTEKEI